MKIQIHNTSKIVELNGIPCRVWEGTTESGIEVHAFIPRIVIADKSKRTDAYNELIQMAPPSPTVAEYPLELTL